MTQRKALIASLIITLVLALSAIGIRAAMVDTPDNSGDSAGTLTLVEPGGDFDDDDSYQGDDDAFWRFDDDDDGDDNDRDHAEDDENEDDDEDEE